MTTDRRRNTDERLRDLEKRARRGDPDAAVRLAQEIRRRGGMDPAVDAAAQFLDEGRANDLMGCWAVAGSEGRIRLYRAMAAAGIRYPSAAFLSALSGDERILCCVSALYGMSDRWDDRLRYLGLNHHPHSIEVVHPDRRDPVSGRVVGAGNQRDYMGPEGLERARAQGAAIEEEWAELVRVVFNHTDGGFVEHITFLTPTGYAQRSVYFHGPDHEGRWLSGVSHWDYDIREGHLSSAPDPLQAERSFDLPFISAVHELELQVQKLLAGASGFGGSRQERAPGQVVDRATRQWMNERPRRLVHQYQSCASYNGPLAFCLVVIPASSGIPPVTIGIKALRGDAKPRHPTPAHFWPELGPWPPTPRGLRQPDWDDPSVAEGAITERERRLRAPAFVKRLERWAAADSPDKIRVENGNVAIVWQDWGHRMTERIEQIRHST